MRNCLKTIISISALVSVLGLNSSVFGVAAFARQTGLDCTSCHASVGFPTLNTFGQAFKAGGFINGDDANMMGDGEALSIPKNLNMSIVFKMRGALKTEDTVATGVTAKSNFVLNMPDEFAILMGGRVSKNIGYLVEYAGGAASFKMPIVFDLAGGKLGVVPFWTDALGVGYGFENLSTGAVRNIRAVEERSVASAASFVSGKVQENITGDDLVLAGGASGVTAYYWMGIAHVAVTGFAPASTEALGEVVQPGFAQYIRAVVTPSVGGLDLAVGVQKTLGTPSFKDSDNVSPGARLNEQNYLGVDAQVMGTIGMPVALFVTYGQADNLTNGAGDAQSGVEASAITVLGDVQLIENTLNVAAGMRLGSYTGHTVVGTTDTAGDTITDNALMAEVKFNLARNMRLSFDWKKEIGDIDDPTTLTKVEGPAKRSSAYRVMLFGSF
jgi:hypothetical protein